MRPGYHTQLSYSQASTVQRQSNPSIPLSRSQTGQQMNPIGHQSHSVVPMGQYPIHSVPNPRTSTVFSHHQTGSHPPHVTPQPFSTAGSLPQVYQPHLQERTLQFAPLPSAFSNVSIHNNPQMAYHSPQMPNPSSVLSPTMSYAHNLPQTLNSHHPPMT